MLLCVLDHPTQYDPPLWRAMEQAGRLRPTVWYTRPRAPADREISQQVDWSGSEGGYENRHVPLAAVGRELLALRPRPSAIIVAGWKRPATLQVLPVARMLGIPVIVQSDKTLNEQSPGGPGGVAYTFLHATKSRLFDGFFTTGILGRQYLASLGCPHERIATGLYPVDIDFWQQRKAALRSTTENIRQSLPSRAFVVLAVAKLSERENPYTLLEGFAELRRARPDAFYLHVGDGPLRGDVEQRIRDMNLADSVRIAGYVRYGELAAYYAAANVFAHIPTKEPWGISVSEAMACGVPVVASTAVGSAADLVVPGRTGALSYPRDAHSVASALNQVAVKSQTEDLGARAFQHVQRMGVAAVAGRVADLVDTVRQGDEGPLPLRTVLSSEIRNHYGRWSA